MSNRKRRKNAPQAEHKLTTTFGQNCIYLINFLLPLTTKDILNFFKIGDSGLFGITEILEITTETRLNDMKNR